MSKRKSSGLGDAKGVFDKVVKPPPVEKVLRKRRKDYKGGDLKDYHKSKVVAARIPEDQHEMIKEAAEKEGISINAWMVQFIEKYLPQELGE